MSPLLVVGGLPGSGTTTVARPLAEALGQVLLAKDTIKEALLDSLGWADEADSARLGRAAMDTLFALAADAPSAVLEANWRPDLAVPRLLALGRPLVQVHCTAPPDVLHRRVLERSSAGRHPGHRDAMRPEALAEEVRRQAVAGWPPLDLGGPTLVVDTSAMVDVGALADAVLSPGSC